MNMRIVYTAPRYHTNQHFAMKALIEAGHEVSFLALTCGQSEEYSALSPTILGYSRAYDLMRRLLGKLTGRDFVGVPPGDRIPPDRIPPIPRFLDEMRKLRPKVMVVRNPSSGYGRLSILAAMMSRAKLILYTQDPIDRLRANPPKTFQLIKRSKLSAGLSWITPVSNPAALTDKKTASKDIHYVPFVMDPQTGPEEKRWFRDDCINILHIGKYEPRKNHLMFLQAVCRLTEKYPIRATIIGERSTPDHRHEFEKLERHRASWRLENHVEMKFNLSFGEVQKEYRRHDVFVLASRDEPAAISPLEAMAHSLPVICSDSNGTMCYIRPGENGFVFRTNDADDLEMCLERILKDRKRLIQMGRVSHELVVSEHSPERYVGSH